MSRVNISESFLYHQHDSIMVITKVARVYLKSAYAPEFTKTVLSSLG